MGVERKKSNSGRREADVNSPEAIFYTEGSRRNDTVQRWSCWLVMNLLSIVHSGDLSTVVMGQASH